MRGSMVGDHLAAWHESRQRYCHNDAIHELWHKSWRKIITARHLVFSCNIQARHETPATYVV